MNNIIYPNVKHNVKHNVNPNPNPNPNHTPSISVVILNWLRPDNIKNLILPELSECPIIGEIIISHGRSDTKFNCYSNRVSIIHRDDTDNNEALGLSLRLYAARQAKYPVIVFIDDDLIVYPVTLVNMFRLYQQNSPCLVGRFGRYINKDLSYNHLELAKTNHQAPISLTSLLMVPKQICLSFLQKQHQVLDYVTRFSRPLWNGEDIFISLLGLITYDKWAIICDNNKYFPVRKLRSQRDLSVAISNDVDNNHINYRSGLIKNISVSFRIHPSLLISAPRLKHKKSRKFY